MLNIYPPLDEVQVQAGRRFSFDYAFPAIKLAIEIDGIVHRVHHDKWERDMEKMNLAVLNGWHVLHFTPDQLQKFHLSGMMETVKQAYDMLTEKLGK